VSNMKHLFIGQNVVHKVLQSVAANMAIPLSKSLRQGCSQNLVLPTAPVLCVYALFFHLVAPPTTTYLHSPTYKQVLGGSLLISSHLQQQYMALTTGSIHCYSLPVLPEHGQKYLIPWKFFGKHLVQSMSPESLYHDSRSHGDTHSRYQLVIKETAIGKIVSSFQFNLP
jgi:hypothetical protein